MKEPKWTGPKKNHAAIWLIEDPNNNDEYSRIRILHSDESWHWGYMLDENGDFNDEWPYRTYWSKPCWLRAEQNLGDQILEMLLYDRRGNDETIFLGYVKDFE